MVDEPKLRQMLRTLEGKAIKCIKNKKEADEAAKLTYVDETTRGGQEQPHETRTQDTDLRRDVNDGQRTPEEDNRWRQGLNKH